MPEQPIVKPEGMPTLARMTTFDQADAEFEKGSVHVMVAVRVRPMNRKEAAAAENYCLEVVNAHEIRQLNKVRAANDYLRRNKTTEKSYHYDHTFGEERNNQFVYEHTTKLLVPSVIDGFNATAFCYGATGAGKTFTMLGTLEDPGIMLRTLKALFAQLNTKLETNVINTFDVHLTYLEVYNEHIRDLLSAQRTEGPGMELREDSHGIRVAGITKYDCKNTEQVMDLLHKGNNRRTTESTAANAVSSRSHAVLQIYVKTTQTKETKAGEKTISKTGKFSLIDLAGSERARKTENSGQRLVEGANINRSLLALANCINALGAKKPVHIPYRDSKLTRLLKDSLGGNCRTVMIANVSPSDGSYEETHNTMKYAERASLIKSSKLARKVEHHYKQKLLKQHSPSLPALHESPVRQGKKQASSPTTTTSSTSSKQKAQLVVDPPRTSFPALSPTSSTSSSSTSSSSSSSSSSSNGKSGVSFKTNNSKNDRRSQRPSPQRSRSDHQIEDNHSLQLKTYKKRLSAHTTFHRNNNNNKSKYQARDLTLLKLGMRGGRNHHNNRKQHSHTQFDDAFEDMLAEMQDQKSLMHELVDLMQMDLANNRIVNRLHMEVNMWGQDAWEHGKPTNVTVAEGEIRERTDSLRKNSRLQRTLTASIDENSDAIEALWRELQNYNVPKRLKLEAEISYQNFQLKLERQKARERDLNAKLMLTGKDREILKLEHEMRDKDLRLQRMQEKYTSQDH